MHQVLAAGQEHDFKIIRLEPEQHKISLSYRAAQKQVERQEMETFRSSKSSPNATIGDAILAKRQSLVGGRLERNGSSRKTTSRSNNHLPWARLMISKGL